MLKTHCARGSIETRLHFFTVVKLFLTVWPCETRQALARRIEQPIVAGSIVHTWLRGAVVYVNTAVVAVIPRWAVTQVPQRTLRTTNTVLCAMICAHMNFIYATMNTNMLSTRFIKWWCDQLIFLIANMSFIWAVMCDYFGRGLFKHWHTHT